MRRQDASLFFMSLRFFKLGSFFIYQFLRHRGEISFFTRQYDADGLKQNFGVLKKRDVFCILHVIIAALYPA